MQEGLNEAWLPVWLQDLGYNTYYTGKLFNAHNVDNYNAPLVNGFNGSDFPLDPVGILYQELCEVAFYTDVIVSVHLRVLQRPHDPQRRRASQLRRPILPRRCGSEGA